MKLVLVKMKDDFAPNGERLRLHVGNNKEVDQIVNSIKKFNCDVEIIDEKEFNDLGLLIQQNFYNER